MPFKSKAQRRACWAQYNRDKKAGRKPKWDCKEWEAATPKELPERVRATMPNAVLLFKQDLDTFSTAELKALQRYLDLPDTNREDLLWLIAIHQVQKR